MAPSALAEIPSEQRAALAELVQRRGIVAAIRISGLGRTALLSIIARGVASRGSAALAREWYSAREQAAPLSDRAEIPAIVRAGRGPWA